jgi:hypothetical protein
MANVSRIFGARPMGQLGAGSFSGRVSMYAIPAADGTAVFVGDIVKLSGTSDADGVATVIQAAAGNTPVGVVVGFVPDYSNLALQYRVASTLRYCWVADDPALVFEMQEDAVGGALALASVGLNADIIVGSGSTTTGQSGMQLDTSTAATTATLVVQILGFIQRPDNEVASANAKVLCRFNVHQYNSVGVLGA